MPSLDQSDGRQGNELTNKSCTTSVAKILHLTLDDK